MFQESSSVVKDLEMLNVKTVVFHKIVHQQCIYCLVKIVSFTQFAVQKPNFYQILGGHLSMSLFTSSGQHVLTNRALYQTLMNNRY
jgi:hypothetical protein